MKNSSKYKRLLILFNKNVIEISLKIKVEYILQLFIYHEVSTFYNKSLFIFRTNLYTLLLMKLQMEASEPKWLNPILNIISVNSLRLGGIHIYYNLFKWNRKKENYKNAIIDI